MQELKQTWEAPKLEELLLMNTESGILPSIIEDGYYSTHN